MTILPLKITDIPAPLSTVILKVLNFMDASRWINKDFHAKEKKVPAKWVEINFRGALLFRSGIVAESGHKMARH